MKYELGPGRYCRAGRVYQAIRYGVNPSTGTVGEHLIDNTWYDVAGNVLCSLPSGSNAFTKSVYDGIGRVPTSYMGYNPDAVITPDSVADDKIFEQLETEYDGASNVLMTTSRQRWHNATGLGPLNGPSGSQPKSRDSYRAMWVDGVGRTLASANYGTNDNAGPPTRPDEPPESSDLILVSRTNYNERGEAFESIDPAGKVDRSYADNAGRTVRTIQNYVAVTQPGCFCQGSEQNVTTEMRYGPGNQRIAILAKNPDTGDQITRYEYGVKLSNSDLSSNELLLAEIYPDSADSADRVTFGYNRQGERIKMRDQNGSVHDYSHDLLGRHLADAVTTVGPGVDDAILRIGRTYEVRGMIEKITSYDAASGGSVVNEVENAYNDFAQLEKQYQEHAGAVNTGTSPKVEYAYEDGSANTIRPTTMAYPGGQGLPYLYDDDDADNLSRIRTLNFDGDEVCRYTYLGLSTFVTTDYLLPEVKLDYANGSTPNPYTGFDQFGRIIDLLWQSYASSSSSSSSSEDPPGLVHLQYTYDRASNRTSRADLIAQWYDKDFDELYGYDGMHRLKNFHRGRLIESDTVIESPAIQQGWQLDATGNWRNFTQNDQADAANTLDQQRLANRVNEITAIARTVGANWVTPEYDRNGNMTLIPQPKEPTLAYRGTWDAWNRLVELEEPDSGSGWQALAHYSYNGQSWRTAKQVFISAVLDETHHFYFSNLWQEIEERTEISSTNAESHEQFVWGARYLDDLIFRDRYVENTHDARMFVMQDANWNVVFALQQDCEVRFVYSAYGEPSALLSDYGTGAGWTVTSNRCLFTGQMLEPESGLYLFRMRRYHSAVGYFTSRDPVGLQYRESNVYNYVNNIPTRRTDPLGLLYWEGPEAAIVSFIDGFKPTDDLFFQFQAEAQKQGLDQELQLGDFHRVMVMLGLLSESANPRPANTYTSWGTILVSKEYRGFVRAQLQVECCNNAVKSYRADWKTDHGWTPIRLVNHYEAGEGSSEAGASYASTLNSNTWTNPPSATPTCIRVVFKHEFRIGWVGQFFARLGFGGGVPLAWADIEYRVCCNGSYSIDFHGSDFPSHYAYINKTKIGQHSQGDLAAFTFRTPDARAAGAKFAASTGTATARATWTLLNQGP